MYLAGNGDVIGTYRHWAAGQSDPAQVSATYSGQFYDVCRQLGADALVISQNKRVDQHVDGRFRIEHRPNRFGRARGPFYHLGLWLVGLGYVIRAVRFGADVVIASNGMAGWPPMRLLRLFRIQLVPSILCVLWLKQHPPTGRFRRWLLRRDRATFAKQATATLSMSQDITDQIMELTGGAAKPVLPFLPTYQRSSFDDLPPPPAQRSPFFVLFAGRIETNKGVFDLLEAAKLLQNQGAAPVVFDLCGTGSALDALRQAVAGAGLGDTFRCHGHCDRPTMRKMFANAHVVVVPTTSWFVEGFNQVVAEGVLAGRPVITSSVCPAVAQVRAAVVEVPPDDVAAYAAAIRSLRDNQELYERKRAACAALAEPFFDPQQSWAAALTRALQLGGIRS